jgi:hypothetical protein
MEKFQHLVVIDLGKLSKTKFCDSVSRAEIEIASGSEPRLAVDTGVIKKSFSLSENAVPGTYVVYDEAGSVMGSSNVEYSVSE